jgi:hypothetical protein
MKGINKFRVCSYEFRVCNFESVGCQSYESERRGEVKKMRKGEDDRGRREII